MLRGFAVLTVTVSMLVLAAPASADDASLGQSWTNFLKVQKVFEKQADKRISRLADVKGDDLEASRPLLRGIRKVLDDGRGLLRAARPQFVADRATSKTGVRGRSFSISTIDTADRAYRQLLAGFTGIERAVRLERAGRKKAAERRAERAIDLVIASAITGEKADKLEKKTTRLYAQAARERAAAPTP